MTVHVHVERLVLEGFPSADRHRIGEAVERELARLLAERGLPAGLETGHLALGRVDGGSFERTGAEPARVLGARVAEGIYHGLGGGGREER